jgi:predicted enzyme related to lactoylglutathione lyase
MIEGVAGVIIWTDNLEGMLAFYRDTLGLRPHSTRPGFVAFKWGEVRLSIGMHSEVAGQTKEPHRIMVNLAVSDIHRAYEALSARGVKFLRPPEKEHWGGWVSTFADPDGNILQLLQQPESR